MAESKTTGRTAGTTRGGKTSTTSPAASGAPQTEQITLDPRPQPSLDVVDARTGRSIGTTPVTPATEEPRQSAAPKPGPRLDVRVNVGSISTAFYERNRSRSVGLLQHVLRERGFDPGNVDGVAGFKTRAAYADFQRSINESPTGIPTADSLNLLGFDVVG